MAAAGGGASALGRAVIVALFVVTPELDGCGDGAPAVATAVEAAGGAVDVSLGAVGSSWGIGSTAGVHLVDGSAVVGSAALVMVDLIPTLAGLPSGLVDAPSAAAALAEGAADDEDGGSVDLIGGSASSDGLDFIVYWDYCWILIGQCGFDFVWQCRDDL